MAKSRSIRNRQVTYKKHLLETWTPAAGRWEGRVVDGPTTCHNTEYGYKRSKVLAQLKESVTKALQHP